MYCTKRKDLFRAHLYNLKKPCATKTEEGGRNIVLTDDVKQNVLINRVYIEEDHTNVPHDMPLSPAVSQHGGTHAK
jgi:hypothetical protein